MELFMQPRKFANAVGAGALFVLAASAVPACEITTPVSASASLFDLHFAAPQKSDGAYMGKGLGSGFASLQPLAASAPEPHAAAGFPCLMALYNHGRPQDFRFHAGGALHGLKDSGNFLAQSYGARHAPFPERIFSIAYGYGAALRPERLADFWKRVGASVGAQWKAHSAHTGYALAASRPRDLPVAGAVTATTSGLFAGRLQADL
jgi:hypothetical protein